jgi:AraC-like DNA-binding protein
MRGSYVFNICRLLLRTQTYVNDKAFVLRLASEIGAIFFDLNDEVDEVLKRSTLTLGEVVDDFVKSVNSDHVVSSITVEKTAEDWRIEFNTEGLERWRVQQFADFYVGSLRYMLGGKTCTVPGDSLPYYELAHLNTSGSRPFGYLESPRIAYTRNCLTIVLDQKWLSREMPLDSLSIIKRIVALQTSILSNSSLEGKTAVAIIVTGALPSAKLSLGLVASIMHLTARTLQNLLEREKITFSCILESVRKNLALKYVTAQHIELSQVAKLLGYRQYPSFSRAFHDWFAQSPVQYRMHFGKTIEIPEIKQ